MGGAALHLGNIAEMKTGEGKTLVSTLPAYLNALAGKGVHIVTTNDYLAQRDSEWMGRVHRFLGLERRRHPVPADPGRPRGRPTTPTSPTAPTTSSASTTCATTWPGPTTIWCSAATAFAIVDEVDSILIDEARTPLIISGPADQSSKWYTEFARLVPRLIKDVDYEVDESKRTVGVTEDGRRQGRAGVRHREPVRVGEHPAGRIPEQRAEGQGAVQEGPRLHRGLRRGADRRRVHRPGAARPALQRGHAPGHRGQGGRGDQGREPDPGHHHPAELLPALREARRDDRYRADRGRRAATRSTSSAWCRSRRTSRWSGSTRPT